MISSHQSQHMRNHIQLSQPKLPLLTDASIDNPYPNHPPTYPLNESLEIELRNGASFVRRKVAGQQNTAKKNEMSQSRSSRIRLPNDSTSMLDNTLLNMKEKRRMITRTMLLRP